MALLFSPSIANMFVFRGILGAVTGITLTGGSVPLQPTVTLAATIYSGVKPTAAAITASWSSYNTTYLFHQPGVNYIQANFNLVPGGGFLTRSNVPTSVTALNGGTASWCIIWCSNVVAGTGAGQIGNATLPNANFIVGDVTVGSGDGIVTLSSLTVTGGSSVTILDSTIEFYVP